MQAQTTTKEKVKEFYKSGFPKEVTRGKYNMKINERLKAARNRKGLSSAGTVAELKKQGKSIGHSTLQGYEADENSRNHRYPSLRILMTLAEFYGCSLDYLVGNTDYFEVQQLDEKIELRDVLESERPLTFNGAKVTKRQQKMISAQINLILGE